MGEAVRPHRSGELGSWPKKSHKGRIWALVALSAAVALVLAVLGKEPPPPGNEIVEPPAAAIGRWTTTDARYADRYLTVTRTSVSLGLGQGVPADEGGITAVRTWMEGPVQVVYLQYATVDGDQVLEMLLSGPNRMQLRNPLEVVWTRSR